MYTEQSIDLKSDFYNRYGETAGRLFFIRSGLPCMLLEGDESYLGFSFGCGIKAYGRAYGDVLRIMNDDSAKCSVKVLPGGEGAQILYKSDIPEFYGTEETIVYSIQRLLKMMGKNQNRTASFSGICNEYGSDGWCAYCDRGTIRQLPLPLQNYNAIVISVGRLREKRDETLSLLFGKSENDRIKATADALRSCRESVLFEMMRQSEKSIEKLLSPSKQAVAAARVANGTDGVGAARICRYGVLAFCKKNKTDSVIHAIKTECRENFGCEVAIYVVK